MLWSVRTAGWWTATAVTGIAATAAAVAWWQGRIGGAWSVVCASAMAVAAALLAGSLRRDARRCRRFAAVVANRLRQVAPEGQVVALRWRGEGMVREARRVLGQVDDLIALWNSREQNTVRQFDRRVRDWEQRAFVFAASSHDLKGPLNGISGFAELLSSQVPRDDAQVDAALDSLVRASRRLVLAVTDILEAAKMDAGAFSLHCDWVAAASLVREVVGAAVGLWPRDRAERLDVDMAAGLPPVWVDKERLARVVGSLVAAAGNRLPDAWWRMCVTTERWESREWMSIQLVLVRGADIEAHRRFFYRVFTTGTGVEWASEGLVSLQARLARAVVHQHGGRLVVPEPDYLFGRGPLFVVALPLEEGGVTIFPSGDPQDA